MSARFEIISTVSSIVSLVFLIALSVGAVLAVVKLRHVGSWLLLAGTFVQWVSFASFLLFRYVVSYWDSDYIFAVQMGTGGLGRLLVVAGLILIVLYAVGLKSRAAVLEQLAGTEPRGGLPTR